MKVMTGERLKKSLEARLRAVFREACDDVISGDENAEKSICKYEAYARLYALNGFDLELLESQLRGELR